MNEDQIDIDWAAVRAEYEAGTKKVVAILEDYGIDRTALYDRRKADNWLRRTTQSRTSRKALIRRLFRMLDSQITQLETNMNDAGDKEVALLGTLTRNLEKLIELDMKQKARSGKVARRADIDSLRQKLADRIATLRKS